MRVAQIAQMVFVVVAALAVYSFVTAARDSEARRACAALCHLSPNYAARNRTAPDFELQSLDGRRVKLSDFRGKTVVMNFWTKTCRPCLEEMPSIAELAQSVADRDDIVVLTVSTDESVADAKSTLASVLGENPPFVTVVDPDAEVVAGKYGTKLYPETWIVDPDGVIRVRFDGPRDWADALSIDLIDAVGDRFVECPIEFSGGRPLGKGEGRCDAITS